MWLCDFESCLRIVILSASIFALLSLLLIRIMLLCLYETWIFIRILADYLSERRKKWHESIMKCDKDILNVCEIK